MRNVERKHILELFQVMPMVIDQNILKFVQTKNVNIMMDKTESNWKKFWNRWDKKTSGLQEWIYFREFKLEFCELLLKEEKKAEKDVELLKEYMNKLTKNGKNPTHKIFVNLVEQGKRDGRRVFAIKMRKTIEEKK